MANTPPLDLSLGNVDEASKNIGQIVRVSGYTSKQGTPDAAEMVGTLLGITFTTHAVIVYMDVNQSTAFSRTTPIWLRNITSEKYEKSS